MTVQDLNYCTMGRYLGRVVVFGTRVDNSTIWVRWFVGRSWFKLEASEIEEF